jgi:hypothetical protein
MCYFKNQGAILYDFGGANTHARPLSFFKERFGGVPLLEHHFYYPFTPLGEAVLTSLKRFP